MEPRGERADRVERSRERDDARMSSVRERANVDARRREDVDELRTRGGNDDAQERRSLVRCGERDGGAAVRWELRRVSGERVVRRAGTAHLHSDEFF